MSIENYQWLAALIAAHPEQTVVGRTRLQKETKLLQRLGFPTDYSYTIHFYGPYSESLQFDIGLLESFGLVEESAKLSAEGNPYYLLRAKKSENLPAIDKFGVYIGILSEAPPVVLELAATYDAFRESGSDHDDALQRLRRKKGSKCADGNEEQSLDLLVTLGLETG